MVPRAWIDWQVRDQLVRLVEDLVFMKVKDPLEEPTDDYYDYYDDNFEQSAPFNSETQLPILRLEESEACFNAVSVCREQLLASGSHLSPLERLNARLGLIFATHKEVVHKYSYK